MSKMEINKLKKNPFSQVMKKYQILQEQQDGENVFEKIFKQEGNEWTHGVRKNEMINAEIVEVDIKNQKVVVRTGLKSNSEIPLREFRVNEEQIIPTIGSVVPVVMEGIDANGRVFVSYKKVKFEERMKEIEQIYLNKQSSEYNKQNRPVDPSLKATVEGIVLYKQKVSVVGAGSHQYKNNSYVVDLGCGVLAIAIPDGFTELEPGSKATFYVNKWDTRRFGIILGVKKGETESDHHYHEIGRSYENQENVKEGETFTLRVIEHKDFGVLCVKAEEKDEKKTSNTYFVSSKELTLNKRIRKKTETMTLYPVSKVFPVVTISVQDSSGKKKLILSARMLFKDLMQRFVDHVKASLPSGEEKVAPLMSTIIEKRESELIVKLDFENNIVEGKVHRDDLNWSIGKSINQFRTLNIGDKLEVAINWMDLNMETLDPEYHFLPLNVKILQPDPLQSVIGAVAVGHTYPCTFNSYNEYGALMSLKIGDKWTDPNVDIVIQNRELKELSRDINTKSGATNHAKVTRIDTQHRCIYVSIKSAEVDDIAKYSSGQQSNGHATLGNIMKKRQKIS